MVIRSKILYEETSKRSSLPIELIESIGNAVFARLRQKLEDPTELAYELPRFATFNQRFSKFEPYYENFQKQLDRGDPEAIKKRDDNPELYEKNTRTYNKMQEYRKHKQEVKQKRNAESEDNID